MDYNLYLLNISYMSRTCLTISLYRTPAKEYTTLYKEIPNVTEFNSPLKVNGKIQSHRESRENIKIKVNLNFIQF